MAAEDLRALAWLHEMERAPAVLVELHRSGFPQTLSLLPPTHDAVTQMAAALAAIADTTRDAAARCTDDLAADYAGIYLTHAMRAAPYESVWRDEDQLMMQAPTFAVRDFYTRHGMVVQNWRHQPDDHLSHELRFVALLLERGERREASRFLRTHLLVWLPLFTEKVELACRDPLLRRLGYLDPCLCAIMCGESAQRSGDPTGFCRILIVQRARLRHGLGRVKQCANRRMGSVVAREPDRPCRTLCASANCAQHLPGLCGCLST
jgi:TorA maturation chaperone TorD